ncbi:MAG: hypothetical protein ACRYFS_11940 [Janthinobacterium lividum]
MSNEEFTFDNMLSQVKEASATMKDSLPSRVDPYTISRISKLPFKAVAIRELLLHRGSELASIACELYERQSGVSAYILTRSFLETTAILYWLYQRVEEVTKTGIVGEIDEFLVKMLMGTRNPDLPVISYNILTAVDRVARTFTPFREMYDDLSEYVHPNWYGTQAAYGKLDAENEWLDLGAGVSDWPTEIGLGYLLSSLQIFELYYNSLADLFPIFAEICDKDIDNRAAHAE